MDKKDFDLMRRKAGELRGEDRAGDSLVPEVSDLFSDIINTLERIWNTLTSSPVDISEHDEHGRVEL